MTADDDAPRFRAHAAMLREATKGIGKDIEVEFKDLEKDIARLPRTVGRDYDNLRVEIEMKLARLAIRAHKFRKEFPKEVKTDLKKAGHAAKRGAIVAVEAPAVGVYRGAKAAKKGAKKEFAKAAGVYHDPLAEWNHPREVTPKTSP